MIFQYNVIHRDTPVFQLVSTIAVTFMMKHAQQINPARNTMKGLKGIKH